MRILFQKLFASTVRKKAFMIQIGEKLIVLKKSQVQKSFVVSEHIFLLDLMCNSALICKWKNYIDCKSKYLNE